MTNTLDTIFRLLKLTFANSSVLRDPAQFAPSRLRRRTFSCGNCGNTAFFSFITHGRPRSIGSSNTAHRMNRIARVVLTTNSTDQHQQSLVAYVWVSRRGLDMPVPRAHRHLVPTIEIPTNLNDIGDVSPAGPSVLLRAPN